MNTPNEMIAAVRDLLREVILPELDSELARARLRQVMATLRAVDWDETPLSLLRENQALRQFIATWGAPVAPADAVGAPYADVRRHNTLLRAQLARHFLQPGLHWSPAHRIAAQILADCAAAQKPASRVR